MADGKVQLFNNPEPTFQEWLEISAKRTTPGELESEDGEFRTNVPVFTTIYPLSLIRLTINLQA